MRAAATAGLGFLLGVLWFDLMFDIQVRGHSGAELPADVLDSIAAYYRRVTTNARPMNRLVAAAMLATLAALVVELARGDTPAWVAATSLALATAAIGLAGARTVRNAVRLGGQADPVTMQSALARAIFREHILCAVAVSAALVLQVAAG